MVGGVEEHMWVDSKVGVKASEGNRSMTGSDVVGLGAGEEL